MSMRVIVRLVLIASAFAASGCGGETLIPTPYVMRGERGPEVFARAAPAVRTPEIPVVYVTDRSMTEAGPEGPEYGSGRSKTVDFGVARIALTPAASWEELVADSVTGDRERTYKPRVASVKKLGSFDSPSMRYELHEGRLRLKPDSVARFREQVNMLHEVIRIATEGAERREAAVFVHGFDNTFDDAILRMGQAWHASGRVGVPIVFTWPAGYGGMFGYAYDRESGEYAVMHLKLLLLTLAANPNLEKIHVISHSRGTDVASTALRELHLEVRGLARGRSMVDDLRPDGEAGNAIAPCATYKTLKMATLVLAAPDLDLDVFVQRFIGDNVFQAAERTIIYFSADDGALGLSNWLFSGRRRLGALRVDDVPEESRPMFAELDALELINCKVTGFTSHSYILQHPAALSDLILALYDGRRPGAENGRPLKRVAPGIWELDNDYLRSTGASVDVPAARAGTP